MLVISVFSGFVLTGWCFVVAGTMFRDWRNDSDKLTLALAIFFLAIGSRTGMQTYLLLIGVPPPVINVPTILILTFRLLVLGAIAYLTYQLWRTKRVEDDYSRPNRTTAQT